MKRIKVNVMLVFIMMKLTIIDIFSMVNLNRLYERFNRDIDNPEYMMKTSTRIFTFLILLLAGIIFTMMVIIGFPLLVFTGGLSKRWLKISNHDKIVILRSILENQKFEYSSPYNKI